MKYSHLIIPGLPKSFDLWDSVEAFQPIYEGMKADNIQYDLYPAECDEEKGEDACVLFKYNESATGVYLIHSSFLQTLSLEPSPWASEADVLLYASYINGILKKHKRARLYDKYAPLKELTDEHVQKSFTLLVEHLRPAISPDMQVLELQQSFVKMQWEKEG